MVRFEPVTAGVILITDAGPRISARKAVFARGYETTQFLRRKVVKLKSTYAIVSEPVSEFIGWGYDRCLIWEAARPYFLPANDEGW